MHNFEEDSTTTDFGIKPGRPKFRFPASQLQLLARGSRQGDKCCTVRPSRSGYKYYFFLGQEEAHGRPAGRWGDVMAMVRPWSPAQDHKAVTETRSKPTSAEARVPRRHEPNLPYLVDPWLRTKRIYRRLRQQSSLYPAPAALNMLKVGRI